MSLTAFDREYSEFRDLMAKYYDVEPLDALQILRSANARMKYVLDVKETVKQRGY